MQYKTINNYETMSLKDLALLVIERNKNKNKVETSNDNFVVRTKQNVSKPNVSYSLLKKLKQLNPKQYEWWEERASIMQYDGGMPKNIAEREAYNDVIKYDFFNNLNT
ncbi:MAG: hypothetical protein SFT90_03870 [Rickettsiales bacterium]|nr:hypothetical protein [Rickettsiales bacterium]